MSLQSWLQNSWLVRHTTSAEETANLLRISDRDLAACKAKELPADWKLAIAYNAALQAASGYRASRENHHYRVIQSLECTIAAARKQVDTLDGFRKKRNVSSYDLSGMVSEKEAEEMFKLAVEIRFAVESGSERLTQNCARG
jgi:hypothetical protein